MPGVEYRDRFQTAVLWPGLGTTDNYGVLQVGAPIEIQVRIKDVMTEMQGPDGSTITVDGTIKADRLIPIGSHLFPGTLAQWYAGPGSSGDNDQLLVVKASNKAPDLKNRHQAYGAGYMRWKNKT